MRCEDKLYKNQGNNALLGLLTTRTPGRALDCGCGAGDNARILASRGWTVTGITVSKQESIAASDFCEQVILHDLETGLPRVRLNYDLIVLSHILEHLAYPATLLKQLPQILSPEGVVAVALPNTLFLLQRMKFLCGKFEYEPSGIMDNTHLRFYTFGTGAALLRSNGFQLVHSSADGYFPLRGIRSIIPALLSRFIDKQACAFLPGLFGLQLLYIAKPAGPEHS
jgi:SAM-dependent methyltransferase